MWSILRKQGFFWGRKPNLTFGPEIYFHTKLVQVRGLLWGRSRVQFPSKTTNPSVDSFPFRVVLAGFNTR